VAGGASEGGGEGQAVKDSTEDAMREALQRSCSGNDFVPVFPIDESYPPTPEQVAKGKANFERLCREHGMWDDDEVVRPALVRHGHPLLANEDDIAGLIERVRKLVTEPSTPTTWDADHANIISDYSRPVMLEALKRLMGEPQPRTR
jgi:hypothetical protein